MKQKVEINTPNGLGEVDSIWVSELGFLMVKVYFNNDKRWISYNLGKHNIMNNIITESIINNI